MRFRISYKGGAGSGHFDHAGRPGQVGGSTSDETMAIYNMWNSGSDRKDFIKNLKKLYKGQVVYAYSSGGGGQPSITISFKDGFDTSNFVNAVEKMDNWHITYNNPNDVRWIRGESVDCSTIIMESEYNMSTIGEVNMKFTYKGGPGSGHFDHVGRPGKVGGALPGKGKRKRKSVAGAISASPNFSDYDAFDAARRPFDEDESKFNAGFESRYGLSDYQSKAVYLKALMCNNLSYLSGVDADTVSNIIGAWAVSANDNSLSLMVQQRASELFGVELSDWQKEKIKLLENDYKVPLEEIESISVVGPHLIRTKMDDIDKVLKSMYKSTQEDFAERGYSPDDEVILFRGVVSKSSYGNVNDVVEYNGNTVESWSYDHMVSVQFATYNDDEYTHGTVIAAKVPVKNILSTPYTGFGCLDEREVVIFGNIPNSEVKINATYNVNESGDYNE